MGLGLRSGLGRRLERGLRLAQQVKKARGRR